VNKYRLLKV